MEIGDGWAFKKDEAERALSNYERYQLLKEKAVVVYNDESEKEACEAGKTVIRSCGSGYAHAKYRVIQNPHKLDTFEMALVADSGNLCFGYRVEGGFIKVHTD